MSKIKIPTSKVQRASKFVSTGAKVGGNYLKYFAKKALTGEDDKEQLDEENAKDIYNSLSELKGSALKAAQMLSMDKGVLPDAFAKVFQNAQYSAPPLSFPLVQKTFRRHLGKSPLEIFDTFSKDAIHAASIGQVHKATLDGKTYAVKVQYPGVADSVKSDLRMAKPIAAKIMGVKLKELEHYVDEVETKLLEETDYELELQNGVQLAELCKVISGVTVPNYYPEYSCKRVLTMDWVDGVHIKDWLQTNPDQETKNKIGQLLWDVYHYMIFKMKVVHADPHPGNLLIDEHNHLSIIDFGCVKHVPEDIFTAYYKLLDNNFELSDDLLNEVFEDLEMNLEDDTEEQRALFFNLFKDGISLFCRPFMERTFDFGNLAYFEEIFAKAEEIQSNKQIRKSNAARGTKHAIYLNRVYFGLYNLLHDIGATIDTRKVFEGEFA